MPRPCKKRRICNIPKNKSFKPCNEENYETIILSIDEYEVLRLVDLENLTQEECAKQMNISRASVSAIVESAHRKTAQMLVENKALTIEGGSFIVCENSGQCCGLCGKCNPTGCTHPHQNICPRK